MADTNRDRPTLISLNRFEAKKNAALAIKAFAKLKSDSMVDSARFSQLRLIIAGASFPLTRGISTLV